MSSAVSPLPFRDYSKLSPWQDCSLPSSQWTLCLQSWSCHSRTHIPHPLHSLWGNCIALNHWTHKLEDFCFFFCFFNCSLTFLHSWRQADLIAGFPAVFPLKQARVVGRQFLETNDKNELNYTQRHTKKWLLLRHIKEIKETVYYRRITAVLSLIWICLLLSQGISEPAQHPPDSSFLRNRW